MRARSSSVGIVAMVLTLVLASSCDTSDSAAPATGATFGPYDAAAENRSELITVEPSRVQPGDPVSVFFPDERVRGIHFVLESRRDDGWNLEYHLISDWSDGRDPVSYEAESIDVEVPDIGIGGGGPDVIVIPTEAAAGDYRVCTGNSRPNICARLTVEAGG